MVADQAASVIQYAIIAGADGVDCDFALLGPCNGLLQGGAARVVLAVADDDQNSSNGLGFGTSGQLVCGEGDRIPQSSSTARCELVQGVRAEGLVGSEILNQKHGIADADDEVEIILLHNHILQKLCRRRLLKRETAIDGVAGIDDETETQGKLGFIAKSEDRAGRLTIVANFDVRGCQVSH